MYTAARGPNNEPHKVKTAPKRCKRLLEAQQKLPGSYQTGAHVRVQGPRETRTDAPRGVRVGCTKT